MIARPPRGSLPFAWTGALVFVFSLVYFLYSYLVRFGRVVAGVPGAQPILLDLALFTAFAVHHSLFARSGAKAWLRRFIHPAVERSIYTWIASLLFFLVCWRWEPVPGVVYSVSAPWSVIGYVVQLCGVLLAVRGSKVLDALDLAGVRPVLDARAGNVTRHVPLVTDGVYAFVRHPLYVGWALLVFGTPHMTATRLVFAAVSTAYLIVAIPWEERGLVRQFGAAYDEYRQKVRWRMIPGLY